MTFRNGVCHCSPAILSRCTHCSEATKQTMSWSSLFSHGHGKKCSGHLTGTLGTRSLGMASRTSVSGHCGTVMTTSGITRGMMRTSVAQARTSQRKSNLQFGISRSGARMEAGSDSTPARQKRNLKSLTVTASSRRRALRQGGGKATGLALSGG